MMAIENCPICGKDYSQLSQHLRVSHMVKNVAERKLLLALQSGRVSVRVGCCPVPGCSKESARLDRHLKAHTELTVATRRAMVEKRKKEQILRELAALRASNPEVPLISTLDLQDENEDAPEHPLQEEEEEEPCNRKACIQRREMVANLNSHVDTLTSTIREMSRRFRAVQRRQQRSLDASRQLAKNLLSAMPEVDADDEETVTESAELDISTPQPSSSSQNSSVKSPGHSVGESLPHFPDHIAALSE